MTLRTPIIPHTSIIGLIPHVRLHKDNFSQNRQGSLSPRRVSLGSDAEAERWAAPRQRTGHPLGAA